MTEQTFQDLIVTDAANIENLSSYLNPVAGTYSVSITSASVQDLDTDKPYIDLQMELASVVETVEPVTEKEYAAGSKMGFRFYGTFGVTKFKTLADDAGLFEQTGSNSIVELLENMNGMDVVIVTKTRKDKDDPEKVYSDLKMIVAE